MYTIPLDMTSSTEAMSEEHKWNRVQMPFTSMATCIFPVRICWLPHGFDNLILSIQSQFLKQMIDFL